MNLRAAGKSILKGGLKIAVGILISASVIGLIAYFYNAAEDRERALKEAESARWLKEFSTLRSWPSVSINGCNLELATRWDRGDYGEGEIVFRVRATGATPNPEGGYGFYLKDSDDITIWANAFKGDEFLIIDQNAPELGWQIEGQETLSLEQYKRAVRLAAHSSELPLNPGDR